MFLKDSLRQVKSKLLYLLLEKGRPGDHMSYRPFDYYRCVFIHIPKAAGTSVSKALFGSIGGAHTKLTHFEELYAPKTFDAYFKFTFVRNPYDRIFSAYNYLKKGGGNEKDKAFAEKYLTGITSFESFVMDYLNADTRYAYIHLEPQTDFITKKDGSLGVDFIGRYESLDEGFRYVVDKLGIRRELRHENPTSKIRRTYHDSYTQAMKDKVYQVYENDFKMLNYER